MFLSLLVFGLGNPGSRYSGTRHNAGFLVVERIAERLRIAMRKPAFKRYLIGAGSLRDRKICIVKPLTYMNRSGEVLDQVLRSTGLSLENLLVVCDNLDLSPGNCRLKLRGSSGGHKGLQSVITFAQTSEFMRMFVGIGKPTSREEVIQYVLSEPQEEKLRIEEGVDKAAEAVIMLLHEESRKVMDNLNRRETIT